MSFLLSTGQLRTPGSGFKISRGIGIFASFSKTSPLNLFDPKTFFEPGSFFPFFSSGHRLCLTQFFSAILFPPPRSFVPEPISASPLFQGVFTIARYLSFTLSSPPPETFSSVAPSYAFHSKRFWTGEEARIGVCLF